MRKLVRFWLVLFIGILAIPLQATASEKPHIILVMADDQGWGDMAYNGHPLLKTPHFDEAAKSGIRFDRFYAAAPVCSPTRASVLTGRNPNRMGVFKWGYPMRPQETTLAEALKTAGYVTGHFGKWHLGSVRKESPANPGNNGFDRWVSAPNFYDNDAVMSDEGKAVAMKGESSFIAVDSALEWMEEKKGEGAPIFAVIWFGSPHSPHRAAKEDSDLYSDEKEADREFLGEVTGMDRAYGKLRRRIDELGMRDDTILWYTSDNGGLPKVGSTGGFRGNKGKVYEGGLLVPAILEWPKMIPQPRVINRRCVTSDIYPTLLEIAGVEMENQPVLDGESLLPLITGEESTRLKPLGFWDTLEKGIGTPSDEWMGELLEAQKDGGDLPPHPSSANASQLPDPPYPSNTFPGHSAWINGDWKLHRIEDPKKEAVKWELYNLRTDPFEETDEFEAQEGVVSRMQEELEIWLKSVTGSLNGDDYP